MPVTVAEDRRPRRRHQCRQQDPGRESIVVEGHKDLEVENPQLRRRTKQLEQVNEILRRATAYFARNVLPK